MSKGKCKEQLMILEDWVEWRFVTPPSIKTAQRWCDKQYVPSKKIGKFWFVKIDEELIQTGDPYVDSMISDVLKA